MSTSNAPLSIGNLAQLKRDSGSLVSCERLRWPVLVRYVTSKWLRADGQLTQPCQTLLSTILASEVSGILRDCWKCLTHRRRLPATRV